jgi:hypothetical protein
VAVLIRYDKTIKVILTHYLGVIKYRDRTQHKQPTILTAQEQIITDYKTVNVFLSGMLRNSLKSMYAVSEFEYMK